MNADKQKVNHDYLSIVSALYIILALKDIDDKSKNYLRDAITIVQEMDFLIKETGCKSHLDLLTQISKKDDLIKDLRSKLYSNTKYGHWISEHDCGVTKCSECGWSIEECICWNYCPDCGAKMK